MGTKISLLLILALLYSFDLFAQKNSRLLPFKIEGSINVDTGSVKLDLIFDKDYHPKGVVGMSACSKP